MTREEILSMSAGHELDFLVLEKVFKCTAWEEQRGEYTYVNFQREGEDPPWFRFREKDTHRKRYRQINFSEIDIMKHVIGKIPMFSSVISEAWEVVEEMDKKGFDLKAESTGDLKEVKFINAEKGIFGEGYSYSMPLSICKAAILAVMKE